MQSKTSASLLLIITFLLGGVTGSVSYYLYQRHAPSRQGPPRDPVNDMAKALGLDAQQKVTLKSIMDQSRDRYRALSQQMRPQYDVIRDDTRRQIRHILRDDQKPRFEDFLKEVDRQHRGRDGRPPR